MEALDATVREVMTESVRTVDGEWLPRDRRQPAGDVSEVWRADAEPQRRSGVTSGVTREVRSREIGR